MYFSSLVASTIQHALHERAHPEPEQPGPIKKILGTNNVRDKIKEETEDRANTYGITAHPDSLYKYINVSLLLTSLMI